MGDDHATHGVGVDEASVEDKRYQVVVQNDGLQVQVGRDQNPGCGKGEEPKEGNTRPLAPGAARFHDIQGTFELLAWLVVSSQSCLP